MHTVVMRRTGAAVAVGLLGVVLFAGPAFATASGGAWTDPGAGDIGAGAGDGGSTPASVSGTGGGGSACSYTPLSPSEVTIADDMAAQGWGPPKGQQPGSWYREICPAFGIIVWVPGPAVDPRVLAQQAFDAANIPLPGVHLNPPRGQDQVVHLPTWLWVDNWAPITAAATVGAVTVTVTAVPMRVDWSMGDGGRVTCAGPGTPYDMGRPPESQHTDCSYTYPRSSARSPNGTFQLSATTSWQVTWVAVGIAGAGSFGTIPRTTTVSVPVAEIQAVNH